MASIILHINLLFMAMTERSYRIWSWHFWLSSCNLSKIPERNWSVNTCLDCQYIGLYAYPNENKWNNNKVKFNYLKIRTFSIQNFICTKVHIFFLYGYLLLKIMAFNCFSPFHSFKDHSYIWMIEWEVHTIITSNFLDEKIEKSSSFQI